MKKLTISVAAFALLLLGGTGCVVDDTYSSCATTANCNDTRDECLEVTIPAEGTRGGFCSRGCSSDFDCEINFGFDGVCYSLEGSANICYQQCNEDRDCWSRNVCIPVDLGGVTDFICVPNNG